MIKKYPCQNLLGGTGEAIYHNVDGMCDHPECNPEREMEMKTKDVINVLEANYGWNKKHKNGFSIEQKFIIEDVISILQKQT